MCLLLSYEILCSTLSYMSWLQFIGIGGANNIGNWEATPVYNSMDSSCLLNVIFSQDAFTIYFDTCFEATCQLVVESVSHDIPRYCITINILAHMLLFLWLLRILLLHSGLLILIKYICQHYCPDIMRI